MWVVRLAKKGGGGGTILHRGLQKVQNMQKTIKLTENTNIRKAIAIH